MKDFTMGPWIKGSNNDSWCGKWKNQYIFSFLTVFLLFIPFNDIFAQKTTAENIQGIAPVITPPGGFEIDGNAPAETAGDWESDPGNESAGLFLSGLTPMDFDMGVPENIFDPQYKGGEYSFFYRDDITNNDPTIFTSSNKIDHNPNTYTWGAGSSPNKNEIQTAVVHFTYGDPTHINGANTSSDDLWVIFAADRQVTNGSSYIDFEFLQNSLTMTGLATGSGSFVSEGPDGGRTLDDILVTVEFTQGGAAAKIVVRQWVFENGAYFYKEVSSYPENTIFASVNTNQTVVPWSVYNTAPLPNGSYQYEINQWAEGAVNLTHYFGSGDPCFNISTMFVRTRTSGSSGTSELKDFPRLEQLAINLTPEISFEDPSPVCEPGTVNLEEIIVDGCDDGTLSYWMDEGFQTAVTDPTAVGDGTYYIKCTSNQNSLCYDIKPVIVTVNSLPTATAGNSGPVCYDEETVSLTETGGDAVSWTWSSDGAAVFSNTSAQNPSVTAFVHGEIFTVEVTDANGCVSSDTTTLTVYPEPTATASNGGPVCYDATSLSLFETGGDAVSWTWSSDGAAVFSDINAQNPTVTGFVDGEIFTVNIVDGNDCTSSDSTNVIVYLEPTATAGNSGPVCYDAPSLSLFETGGDAVSWSWSSDGAAVFSDANAQNPTVTGFVHGEIFTVNITDANDCTSSDTTTVTVHPEPTATAGNSGPVCYDAPSITLSETGGDAVSWMWSSDGSAAFSDASAQNPTVSGFADGEIFTVEITDGNGCTSSDTTTVTVYPEPTATAGNSGPVCYDALSITLSETGGDAVSWEWSSDGAAVFNDATVQNPTATGFVDGEIFTVIITDGNDCTSQDTTTVTVYPEPTATAGNGGPACYDDPIVSLSESGGDAVSWMWSSNGSAVFSDASAQNPTVTGFTNGEIFSVEITDGNGCASSDTTTLTVYPEPGCSASNSGPVCAGDDVILSETGGYAVSWLWSSNGGATFNDNTLQNPTASGAVNGEVFTVMITDTNGCTSSCTTTVTVENCDQEACTLGYWKNHTDRWCPDDGSGTFTYYTTTLYYDVFGIIFSDYSNNPDHADLTLLEALNLGGGDIYNLARQSVAALLNTCHDEISYPYSGNLIQDVYNAFVGGNAGTLGSELDRINNLYDCPMGGSSATIAETYPPVEAAVSTQAFTAGPEEKGDIILSPNPFTDLLTITYRFDYTSDVVIEVYAGTTLLRTFSDSNVTNGSSTELTMDFANSNQVYIVVVRTIKEVISKQASKR